MKEKIVKFLVTQKFRFDMSAQFMVFLNFTLLVITASPIIQSFLYNRFGLIVNISALIPFLVFLAFFSAWFFGYILDTRLQYWQNIRTIQIQRNPLILEILQNTNDLKQQIEDLKKELERLKHG